jgi:hypothetical protein
MIWRKTVDRAHYLFLRGIGFDFLCKTTWNMDRLQERKGSEVRAHSVDPETKSASSWMADQGVPRVVREEAQKKSPRQQQL